MTSAGSSVLPGGSATRPRNRYVCTIRGVTTSPQRKRPRGAARREALLEAVLAIVADVGPDAVTHRRVAEQAQLPLASTTYWFDSKEDLLTAALELAARRDVARLETLRSPAPSVTPPRRCSMRCSIPSRSPPAAPR